MSNGKIHMTVNVGVAASLTIAAMYLEVPVEPVLMGGIAGTFITPDYDLRNNLPKSIICKVPLISQIWTFVWWPYHKSVKHRSWVSHSPILSTLIRMGYLSLWILGCILLLEYTLSIDILSSFALDESLILLFGAWCIQDISHIFLDRI